MNKTIIVGICGASGTIYGIRLLKELLKKNVDVYLVISKAGFKVLEHENGYKQDSAEKFFESFLKDQGVLFHSNARLEIYAEDDFFAPFASGSFIHDGMVIAPCSMKTLGTIASGMAFNLIHRAADVCLKERRRLILMTRETPLSPIHLKNMYKAAVSGAIIMPPCPGFYLYPKTIDDLIDTVIARVLDQLEIKHALIRRWGEKKNV